MTNNLLISAIARLGISSDAGLAPEPEAVLAALEHESA
jgi:hypothetical protein